VSSSTVRFRPGHHNRCEAVKKKKRATCVKNFGCENPSQNKDIQNKKIDTCLKKYGHESHNQSDIVKEKKRQTSLDHYGVDNPNQSDIIKSKKKQTCMDHFGVEFPSQHNLVNEKKIKTYREHYGEDHPMHNEKFKESLKSVFQDKYGVDNPSQIEHVKQKKRDTEILHFGMPFPQTFEHRKMCREKMLQLRSMQSCNGEPVNVCIGKYERDCLDQLEKLIDYKIIRNPLLIGYYPDGYIEELNIIIEFDEEHHNWTYQKNIDDKKNLDYKRIGMNVIRIKKQDWLADKDKLIGDFLIFYNDILKLHI